MDITQEELSQIMRLRRETISRIENGRVTPTLAFIHRFSGVATLMEAVKSFRSMNNAIDYPVFYPRGRRDRRTTGQDHVHRGRGGTKLR